MKLIATYMIWFYILENITTGAYPKPYTNRIPSQLTKENVEIMNIVHDLQSIQQRCQEIYRNNKNASFVEIEDELVSLIKFFNCLADNRNSTTSDPKTTLYNYVFLPFEQFLGRIYESVELQTIIDFFETNRIKMRCEEIKEILVGLKDLYSHFSTETESYIDCSKKYVYAHTRPVEPKKMDTAMQNSIIIMNTSEVIRNFMSDYTIFTLPEDEIKKIEHEFKSFYQFHYINKICRFKYQPFEEFFNEQNYKYGLTLFDELNIFFKSQYQLLEEKILSLQTRINCNKKTGNTLLLSYEYYNVLLEAITISEKLLTREIQLKELFNHSIQLSINEARNITENIIATIDIQTIRTYFLRQIKNDLNNKNNGIKQTSDEDDNWMRRLMRKIKK